MIAMVIVVFSILVFVMGLLMIIEYGFDAGNKDQLNRYKLVEIGMSEEVMLEIMGSGYKESMTVDYRTLYEWKKIIYDGPFDRRYMVAKSHTGVKKVDIYCKNGVVDEIKHFNV